MRNDSILSYQSEFQQGVIDLILTIQQKEFKVPITLEQQPDLLTIASFYQQKKGDFWVKFLDNQVVGTIALIDIGKNQGCIRKMFVKREYRGKEWGVAQDLLDNLLNWAKNQGMSELFLGTLQIMHAAQRFYQKNGFIEIDRVNLPPNFPLMAVDNMFFKLHLD